MNGLKLVGAAEAVARIESGQTVAVGGSGHLLQVPDGVLAALGARYAETGSPADLTVVHTMGIEFPPYVRLAEAFRQVETG